MDTIADVRLSLIIPAYNEEQNIKQVVESTIDVFKKELKHFEIIVVDDGSTDRTSNIAKDFMRGTQNVSVVQHRTNKGLGEALITGYQNATNEYVSFLPADGQIAPEEIIKLVRALNGCDMVISNYQERQDSQMRLWLSGVWRVLMKFFLDFDLGSEGPYIFKRSLLEKISLKSTTGLLNLEFPMKVAANGYEMNCITMHCQPRRHGESKVANFPTMIKIFIEMMKLRWL